MSRITENPLGFLKVCLNSGRYFMGIGQLAFVIYTAFIVSSGDVTFYILSALLFLGTIGYIFMDLKVGVPQEQNVLFNLNPEFVALRERQERILELIKSKEK